MDASNIKETVLAVFHTKGQGIGRCILRLVSWNDRAPVVENRQIVLDKETGQERCGKNKGLMAEDVEMLVEKWDSEIKPMFMKHDNEFVPKKSDAKPKNNSPRSRRS